MKRKFSLKREFNVMAASLALFIAPTATAQAPTPQPARALSSASAEAFRPYSPAGEQCPVVDPNAPPKVWPTPSFEVSPGEQQRLIQRLGMDIGREEPDGVFRERTIQSVNEFRILYYGADRAPFRESLTAKELGDLRAFVAQVEEDKKTHGLTLANATALRFAAEATGVSHDTLRRETDNGRAKFVAATNNWLYLVKNYGGRHGLGYFADQITQTNGAAGVQLSVKDGLAFSLIMELQNHPRLNAVMRAEYIKHRADIPALSYKNTLPPVQNLYTLQRDLLTLGFDVTPDGNQGPRTEAALQKFETLYAFFGPADKKPYELIPFFADYARKEAAIHNIPTAAAAAIRLAALKTEADFGYMMELSSAESTFDHNAQASTSSATGLYQFTEDTWLQTIRRHGDKHGLSFLSAQIVNKEDMNGVLVGRAENPFLRVASFELRRDPQYAALMSAEFQMRNRFLIECAVGHVLGRTEMYLGHFLGAQGASAFILRMRANPEASAADLFPQAAAANRSVFYRTNSRGRRVDRSLQDVYDFFSRKFDRDRYESDVSLVYPAGTPLPREAAPAAPAAAASTTQAAAAASASAGEAAAPTHKKAKVRKSRPQKRARR